MTVDENIPNDEHVRLAAVALEEYLLRQMDCLRRYDLEGAVALAEQAQPLAEQVKDSKILRKTEYQHLSQRIETAYRQLLLMIATQQQEVEDKLGQIRDALKAFKVYAD